ncbi:MAG: hypothetical protein A2Y62_13200, partial [Candidatus Fischerbacteria bacterium RBG_13_37_8]
MKIKAFYGLRPKKEVASKIASPPYDVVNTEEAKAYSEGNPISFLHVVRAEIDLPEGTDLYSPQVYKKAGENLQKLIQEGNLIQDTKPCLYLYRLTMDGRKQTGLVSLVACEEYASGKIKIHEKTLRAKEDDRVNYILGTNAHNEPVFFTYRTEERITSLFNNITAHKPMYSFTTKDQFGTVGQEFWIVDDCETITQIESLFLQVPAFYVADGHHRSASAYRVWDKLKRENANHTGNEEYNNFLAVIFPQDQLFIYDYNRLVKDLNNLTSEQFLDKVSEKFNVKAHYASRKPAAIHQFGMYLDQTWYLLEPKQGNVDESNVLGRLDVSLLQDNLLGPILSIDDPKTNPRISFVGGILGMDELEKRVNSGKFKVAFSLFPTRMEDVMSVADSGFTMPP